MRIDDVSKVLPPSPHPLLALPSFRELLAPRVQVDQREMLEYLVLKAPKDLLDARDNLALLGTMELMGNLG